MEWTARIPARSSSRSKPTRMSLSRLGSRIGSLRRSSGKRSMDLSRLGRPTRLTGCWLSS